MRRIHLLTTALLMASAASAQQTIQLFSETFNDPTHLFLLNTAGMGGPSGNNEWIVNNEYSGAPTYPNTPDQNNVVAGTIAGAPYSKYMHIHNKNASVHNANWDPASPSSNFVEIGSGFCTEAMTDVKVSFFWLCEGDANAYGEFYYSIDGGPWVKTGQPKYNNQNIWQYELLQEPAWEDQTNIRIGFRWVNQGGSTNISFAVDDVISVGTYDDVNQPVNITITSVTPNPVCRDNTLIIFFQLSDTFCFGQYIFELSGPNCNWSNPTNLGFINLGPIASGAVGVTIPPTTPLNVCYCVRMTRVSPAPAQVGQASACFEVIDCPITITTHRPVVTMGSGNGEGDSVCIYSVIDVPFNSGPGVFFAGNIYTAELSDTNGVFNVPPTIIGSIPDVNNYPAIPPGNVSGIIPPVPEGCGYYVRVVSSNPAVVGSPWGPFCIKQCDVLTNNIQDVHLCIDEVTADSAQFCLDINTWTTQQQYFTGNEFQVEVHDSKTFAHIAVGPPGLGATFDTVSGCFTITAPPLPQLIAMGLGPGMYYIHILATNGLQQHDLVGSLVRLTIGAPSMYPPVPMNPDSVICTNDISCFTVTPYNSNSKYEWQSPNLWGGNPTMWPYPSLCVNFNGFQGTFLVRVREINNGCYGPWSGYGELTVLGTPGVAITGPIRVCVGDTVHFSVPFEDHTYYEWSAGGGTIADTTNSEADIVWNAAGQYTLQVGAVNPCAADTGYKLVTVIAYPTLNAGPDTTICVGASVVLNANSDGQQFSWEEPGPTQISTGSSVTVTPAVTTIYTITAQNAIGLTKCPVEQTVTVTVEEPAEETDSMIICDNGDGTLDAGEYPANATFLWSPGGQTTREIMITDPGLYTAQVFLPGQVCPDVHYFQVNEKVCNELIFIPNAFSPNGDGDNDFFYVVGTNSEFIEMRIYDRWGELLYTTADIKLGWDGTYNGRQLPIGVYTYVVHYLDLEDKEQIASGNVSLLR